MGNEGRLGLPSSKFIRTNWFDKLIYKLFYWRWNKKLANNDVLRDLFLQYLMEYADYFKMKRKEL